MIKVLRVPLVSPYFVYGATVYLWCITSLRETSSEFYRFELIEECSWIIDFIRILGSLGPAVHTTAEECKNATVTVVLYFGEISVRESKSRCSPDPIVFGKIRFFYMFSDHTETQSHACSVFKFLRLEKHFLR